MRGVLLVAWFVLIVDAVTAVLMGWPLDHLNTAVLVVCAVYAFVGPLLYVLDEYLAGSIA